MSTRIVLCVAAATGRPPDRLPPLYGVVDPEALDAIWPPDGGGSCSMSIPYAGTLVSVNEEGDIRVDLPNRAG